MGSYHFTVRVEFDRLLNNAGVREFHEHLGSTFTIPPFESFATMVHHPSQREFGSGAQQDTGETTAIRVEGLLNASSPAVARALLRKRCEVLWWHSYCRRRMVAEVDGIEFVVDLTIAGDDAGPGAVASAQESGKLAGYPPKAFVAHRWSSTPEMSDATLIAAALSTCGYAVTMDQLDTWGTYVERVSQEAIAAYIARIPACHLFLYVSTEAYEDDVERKWVAEERRVALREAAELRIRLAAVVMQDTPDPADSFADVVVDGRSALRDVRASDGSRSGDTGEFQRRLLAAGLGYGGPTLDPPLAALLAEVVETTTNDLAYGRLQHADRILTATHDSLGMTEEWRLSSARLLAAWGEDHEAAVLAANLLRAPGVQYPTKLDACDLLAGIGHVRMALREWARILRIFLSPSRAELRAISHTYYRTRESMALLLAAMGESEGARAHTSIAAPHALRSVPSMQQRGYLACDACAAFYRPHAGATTVICESCGGHGGLQRDGCTYCGSEWRFVCDRVSAARPCPICGVGSLRWA